MLKFGPRKARSTTFWNRWARGSAATLLLGQGSIAKEGDSRAAGHDPRFQQRFGEGATELDALEAIYPGLLAEILEAEIRRYYDRGLVGKMVTVAILERKKLEPINEKIAEPFRAEVAVPEPEYQEIRGRLGI